MDEHDGALTESLRSLATGLELDWEQSLPDTQDLLRAFEQAVAHRLAYILEHELARLPQLFYRIDVDEAAVDRVFAETVDKAELPHALARLVVARLMRTLDTRRRYADLMSED